MDKKTDNFFPSEDYKIPTTSKYMKLTEGEHNFRILSSALVGWSYFNKENKPVRSRVPFDEMPSDLKKDGRINHFWVFVVYNYEEKCIQIMEVAQKTIQTQMKALIDNSKWGSPKSYDITINRKGTTMNDTEYAVVPNPHTALDASITELYQKSQINLDALFEGLDPFTVDKQ